MQINITESAVTKIKDILAEENDSGLKIRVFVQGGGCSGFQYGFTFDSACSNDDFIIEHQGIDILIDALSMQYLEGSTVDYQEDAMSSNFIINNPQAVSTCGCGSSFSV